MRRSETLVALLAVVLASLAALQITGRLWFAIAAVVLLILVGMSRVRASLLERRTKPTSAGADRAARIREERDRRLGGR
ncbi:MAG TPA: hypothetical protein VK760_08915 [Candidatus Acidoferrales bacterium]|jgi:hypothetical protein|nr:hypothetical protein [Candidatus Acidoferrales bacterium]